MTARAAPRHRRHEPDDGLAGRLSRWLILISLVAAPLALGSVHATAYTPLLIAAALAAALSLAREGRQAPRALWTTPGLPLLAAFLAVILFQLLPLPPGLLHLLSPGTIRLHEKLSLVPLETWLPISVYPTRTARGMAFWIGFSLLYVAAQREAGERPAWRRTALLAIVTTGLLLTIEALVQSASPRPRHIYGLWRPRPSWAVFGAYHNRSHFAGYLTMTVPLALAFLAQSAAGLAAAWRRRRPHWLALGDQAGTCTLRYALAALTLLVGVLAAASRGATGACLASLALAGIVIRRARAATLALFVLGLAALLFVDPAPIETAFRTRGLAASRLPIWRDVWRAVPDFPIFGAGFNAYGRLSPHYQTFNLLERTPQAHNEYLQVLIDTGVIGSAVVLALLVLLARRALSRAGSSTLDAGTLSALAALAIHNLVDFNWQIPANAATFVVLAGLIMRSKGSADAARDGADESRPRRSAPTPPPLPLPVLDARRRRDLESTGLTRGS